MWSCVVWRYLWWYNVVICRVAMIDVLVFNTVTISNTCCGGCEVKHDVLLQFQWIVCYYWQHVHS